MKNKLKSWASRLRDRHMLSIVVTSFLIIIALGGYILKIRSDNKQALENSYNYAFYELAAYMDNINNLLYKAQISRDPIHGAKTMSEIWRQSNLAQSNLSRLPIEQDVIANTSRFLSQTSDFSYSLTLQTINQKAISKEQLTQVKSLSNYAQKLQENISSLSDNLNSGRLHWNEVKKSGSETFSKVSASSGFDELSRTFQDYPGLIYDGPFSEHITNISPAGITGSDIDTNKAKEIAKKFVGKTIGEVSSVTESTNSNIPSFDIAFKLTDDTDGFISISKTGGHVIYMIINKSPQNKLINIDTATKKASEFLNKSGFNSMQSTYYMDENNIATINFAYVKDSVTIYPDLIKVQVDMEKGDILGFESAGYLFSHKKRVLSTPKISKESAQKLLNENLELTYSGLAVIPTKVKTEVLVYEFKGKVDGREFIVYINADTGKEEDILIILHTPNGILTI